MTAFYLILAGMYLYYSKSKYFPHFIFKPNFPGQTWLGLLLTVGGSALFIQSDGVARGLLMAVTACTLAMGMVQLFAVLGKTYFYGMAMVVHLLLLFDLLSYAS
jgi:hypothetical protein